MDKSLALLAFFLTFSVSTELVGSEDVCPELGINYEEKVLMFGSDTTFRCESEVSRWWRSNERCGPFEVYSECEGQSQCTVTVNEGNLRYFYYCCTGNVDELMASTSKKCFHIHISTEILNNDASVPTAARFDQTVTLYVPMYAEPPPNITTLSVSLLHDNTTDITDVQQEYLYTSSTSPKLVWLFTFRIPRVADAMSTLSFAVGFTTVGTSPPPTFPRTFPVVDTSEIVQPTTPPTASTETDNPTSCSHSMLIAALPASVGGLVAGIIVAVVCLSLWQTQRCTRKKSYNPPVSDSTQMGVMNSPDQTESGSTTRPNTLNPAEANGNFQQQLSTDTPLTPGSSENTRLLPATPDTIPSSTQTHPELNPNYDVVSPYAVSPVTTGSITRIQGGSPPRRQAQVGAGATSSECFPPTSHSSEFHPGLSSHTVTAPQPPYPPVTASYPAPSQQQNEPIYSTQGNSNPLKDKRSDSAVTPV